jgi:heme-degrading monooxygenase HmoA
MENLKNGKRTFRVDRFKVPAAARAEFMARSLSTHKLLRTLPGYVDDVLLEQPGDSDVLNIVTIVIWKDAEAFVSARAAAQEHYKKTGFNPGEVIKRLGIEADMTTYQELRN